MTVPAGSVGATGISVPTYDQILAGLTADFQSIYGSDAYVAPDSQDGQFLAIVARAVSDAYDFGVGAFNAFSPSTAQGEGLSSVVKINGIARQAATPSTAVVTIVGTAGTVVTNGSISSVDGSGALWDLSSPVVIPMGGEIDVSATCRDDGDTTAAANSLTVIRTPTLGWQSVTNDDAASPGVAVETDAQLRQRQTISVALPALSVLDSIVGAIANITNVGRSTVYENPTGSTDVEGVPAHSIAVVVEGGNQNTVARTIALKKTPGTGTYGTTTVVVTDSKGIPNTINFFYLDDIPTKVEVTIQPLAGYVSTTGALIKAALALYLDNLGIGVDSYYGRLWGVANLQGADAVAAATVALAAPITQADLDVLSDTYTATLVRQAKVGNAFGTADVPIAFNEAAGGDVADMVLITL